MFASHLDFFNLLWGLFILTYAVCMGGFFLFLLFTFALIPCLHTTPYSIKEARYSKCLPLKLWLGYGEEKSYLSYVGKWKAIVLLPSLPPTHFPTFRLDGKVLLHVMLSIMKAKSNHPSLTRSRNVNVNAHIYCFCCSLSQPPPPSSLY